jgi:hypothetical protein
MRSKPYVQNTPLFIPGEKGLYSLRTGEDGRVMRAILALTRYKRARQNPRKSSKSAHSSWAVLVGVAPSLDIEKA